MFHRTSSGPASPSGHRPSENAWPRQARDDSEIPGTVHYEAARADRLQKRIDRLEAALAPFAADTLPSPRRSKIANDRHGLRCAMSPMEIARTEAYRALASGQASEVSDDR